MPDHPVDTDHYFEEDVTGMAPEALLSRINQWLDQYPENSVQFFWHEGKMIMRKWRVAFTPVDDDGNVLEPDKAPDDPA